MSERCYIPEAKDDEEIELLVSQIKELQRRLKRISNHENELGSRSMSRRPSADRRLSFTREKKLVRSETPRGQAQRLVVVANRLPLSLQRNPATNEWTFQVSAGGLVSALSSVRGLPMTWVGWPGAVVEDLNEQKMIEEILGASNYVPVWMPKSVADRYYSGYSNTVLWPLFHYIPLPIQDLYNSKEMWEAYEAANRLFANTVLKCYQKGDLIWIHDYHLMLLPGMLRAGKRKMKIGFFLHTPFPSSEIYRMLPQRIEILQGLLSSDLIGFHIYDYARHFKSACTRILGAEVNGNVINKFEIIVLIFSSRKLYMEQFLLFQEPSQ